MRAWMLATVLTLAAGWFGLRADDAGAQGLGALRLPAQSGQLAPEGLRGRGAGVSPNDAARIAQQQNGGGRVLSVEPDGGGYRVKLLKNGDVRIVYVPAH